MLKRTLIFVAICLFSALIAWLSGYDFDSRGFGVALWVFWTAVFSLAGSSHPFIKD